MKYVELELYPRHCDPPMLKAGSHLPNAPSHETIIDSSLPSHPGYLSMVIKIQIEGIDTGSTPPPRHTQKRSTLGTKTPKFWRRPRTHPSPSILTTYGVIMMSILLPWSIIAQQQRHASSGMARSNHPPSPPRVSTIESNDPFQHV